MGLLQYLWGVPRITGLGADCVKCFSFLRYQMPMDLGMPVLMLNAGSGK